MYTISSGELRAEILDPAADSVRMGPRYCTGGYIFQIDDEAGPLLSGPTYPDDFNWFDGQGIPDSFAQSPLRDPMKPDAEALIPGIGLCDTVERSVLEFCEWNVDAGPDQIGFRANQRWRDFEFTLERAVSVSGRLVRSYTRLSSACRAQIPVRWFPHPFYPLPGGADLCSLPGPVSVPEGTTYSVGPAGYLRCSDPDAHQAVPVSCGTGEPLTVLQRHPRLGLVSARYGFAAGHIVVWGNGRTFSFEPYLERTVGAGGSLEWTAEYHF